MATRFIEADILPLARKLGIGVVAYGALSRGLLTGTLDGKFAPTDFRAHNPRFQGENFTRNMEKVKSLQTISARLGATPSQLAIAWVMACSRRPLTTTLTSSR